MWVAKFILLLAWCHQALSFSTIPSNDIKIVGLPGGNIESLPGMYVQSFQRWIVEEDSLSEDECALNIEPIAGTSFNEDGWVNPTTINELWWPQDLRPIQTRPLLNVMFKSGVLSYVSMGLDVRVPYMNEDSGEISSWRNYGLRSQPIARQWTSLDVAMEKLFHVEGFIQHSTADEEEMKHDELFETIYAAPILDKVANLIAQIDENSPLMKGFHVVSFPMSDIWVDLPTPKETGGEVKEPTSAYKLVCFATSEPFAGKLLEFDEGMLEMSSTSVLDVSVTRTEAGGKSQYLPEVYKKLYLKNL